MVFENSHTILYSKTNALQFQLFKILSTFGIVIFVSFSHSNEYVQESACVFCLSFL